MVEYCDILPLSSWQALAAELEGADVEELESDSGNVVQLIEESYRVNK